MTGTEVHCTDYGHKQREFAEHNLLTKVHPDVAIYGPSVMH